MTVSIGYKLSAPGLHRDARALSTYELLQRVLKTGSLLVSKEVALARTELKADLTAELGMVKFLVAGAVAARLGVNLLLASAVFALAAWLPGWLAALSLAGLVLAVGAGLGLLGWQRRVRSPLAVTRRTIKEDMQWAKERLV